MVFEETSMTSPATTSAVEVPPAEPLVGNYFVAVYPPFSCWQPAQLPAVEEALQRPADDSPLGIYVHIPFCQKKCDYCYYLSFAGTPARMVDDYIGSVVEEAALYSDYAGVGGRPVSFVYFGGRRPCPGKMFRRFPLDSLLAPSGLSCCRCCAKSGSRG